MDDIKNSAWYKALKEKCESEPDRVHTIFFDQGLKSREEFEEFLLSLDGKLPQNAKIVANYNPTQKATGSAFESDLDRFDKVNFFDEPMDPAKKEFYAQAAKVIHQPTSQIDEEISGKQIPKELLERFRQIDFGNLAQVREQVRKEDEEYQALLKRNRENGIDWHYEDPFFNSQLYKDIKAKCELEPDKIQTIVISQGGLTDEQFTKRLEYIEYLQQAQMVPKNLRFQAIGNRITPPTR